MKKFRLILSLTVLFTFLLVVRCSKSSDPAAPALVKVSGNVTYTNAAGTSATAAGAIIYLANTTDTVSATSDKNGKYHFLNIKAGDYKLTGKFLTNNTNASARLDGLTFTTLTPVDITIASADLSKDVNLTSAGQSGIVPITLNYAWDAGNSKYAQPTLAVGVWNFDNAHSPVTFEFPYRANEGTFTGVFAQTSKCVITFDPNNLAGSSIDVEVDLASVDTRTAGGRDNIMTNMDFGSGAVFSPAATFTKLGCIAGTFGITADAALPSTITTNTKRYAQYKSTSIAKLGDGFVSKGTLSFNGHDVATDLWFKGVPEWLDAPITGTANGRTYSGFEGIMKMKANADFGILSGSVNDATVTIHVSIVAYRL